MAWYKIVTQHFLVVYYGISRFHLYFLKACVYTEKIQVTRGIFHTTRKRCITSMYIYV